MGVLLIHSAITSALIVSRTSATRTIIVVDIGPWAGGQDVVDVNGNSEEAEGSWACFVFEAGDIERDVGGEVWI